MEFFLTYVLPVLISTAISAAFSIIVARCSAKSAYNDEIKKSVYEKRQELYVEVYELIDRLLGNLYLVYDYGSFVKLVLHKKAAMNIYASKCVLDETTPFFKKIIEAWKDYYNQYESEEAKRKEMMLKEGAMQVDGVSSEEFEMDYAQGKDDYIEKNLISESDVSAFLNRLSEKIRDELKTKK